MPAADLNGIRLHYDIAGDGPPLLLIAGLGAHGGAWNPALPHLSRHFRCVTFDNRGTGRSSVPDGPYPIDVLADDAAALIGHLGIAPAHAVGWSLGGSVLQSLLIRHPACISRAVLLNAFPAYNDVQHAWLDSVLALRGSGASRLAQIVFGMPWGLTPRLLADPDAAMAIARTADADALATSDAGFAAQAAGVRCYDSRSDLHRAACKVLVLAGAEDVLTPVSQSAEIAALMPNARLKVLPRGSHRMVQEYTDDTATAIVGFLNERSHT